MIRWFPPIGALGCALAMATPATAADAGRGVEHAFDGDTLVITTDEAAQLRLTPYSDRTVRVQWLRDGETPIPVDDLAMVADHSTAGPLSIVSEDGAQLVLQGPDGELEIVLDLETMSLSFARPGEAPFLETDSVDWADGGDGPVRQTLVARDGERFAGLGHDFFGRIDFDDPGGQSSLELTGREVERRYGDRHQRQSPLVVPFALSSDGYGLFVNTSFDTRFALGGDAGYGFTIDHAIADRGSEQHATLDYFVLLGPADPGADACEGAAIGSDGSCRAGGQFADAACCHSPLETVMDEYTALTGRPRLPQKGMLGLALSDKAHAQISDADFWIRMVRESRAGGWPLDHVVNDNRWRASGGERCESEFDWDEGRYPDPVAFQSFVDEEGLVVTLDFNRCIASKSDGWQTSWNIADNGLVEFGDSAPDLTEVEFRTWWWSLMRDKSLRSELGFPGDALWIDEFDEYGTLTDDRVLSDGRTWDEMRNQWFLLIGQALGEDGWDADISPDKRPFTWIRGQTAGGQRYGTMWSGDIESNFTEMKRQIRGMQAAALAGFAFWGHDATGFFDQHLSNEAFEEMYVQWGLAFGAVTPYWRPHGLGHSRWPQERSEFAQVVARRFGELRYTLMPYIYGAAHEAAKTGTPIIRPMLLEHPREGEAWRRDLQFYFGPDLIAAPNTTAGDDVEVWLPANPGGWYGYWNDEHFATEGEQTTLVRAPFGTLPLYARAGAIVPTRAFAQSTKFLRDDVLGLSVYTGAAGSTEVVEDDGVTEAYQDGAVRTTHVGWSQSAATLTIDPALGSYEGASDAREYRVVFHGLDERPCVAVDGVELDFVAGARETREQSDASAAWDRSGNASRLMVRVPARRVDEVTTIELGAGCADEARRFEAEEGETNGNTGFEPKEDASGSRYVAQTSNPGGFLEVTVTADETRDHWVSIGYANGGDEPASRALVVNGERLGEVMFVPHANWFDFHVKGPVRIPLQKGSNTIRLVTENDSPGKVDYDFIDVLGLPTTELPVRGHAPGEALVLQAEDYSRTHEDGGHAWLERTFPHGGEGEGTVVALPNRGRNAGQGDAQASSPRLDYEVELTEDGPYFVWVRANPHGNGADDSVWVGIDGEIQSSVTFLDATDWAWSRTTMQNTAATITPDGAGRHTLSLWMREDGTYVDQILLTTDADFVPAGDLADPDGKFDDVGGEATDGEAEGCGCRTSGSGRGLGLMALLFGLGLARTRRRQ